ncbi:hypothetical protein ACJX0J_034754, partial [Zea mays]
RLHVGVLLRPPLQLQLLRLSLLRRGRAGRRAFVVAGLALELEGQGLRLGGVGRRTRALEPLAAGAEEVGGGGVGIPGDVADVEGGRRRRPGAGEQRRGSGGVGPGVDLHDGVPPEHGLDGVGAPVPLGAEDRGADAVVGRGGEQVEQARPAVELCEEDGGGRMVQASPQPLRRTRQPLQLIRIFAPPGGGRTDRELLLPGRARAQVQWAAPAWVGRQWFWRGGGRRIRRRGGMDGLRLAECEPELVWRPSRGRCFCLLPSAHPLQEAASAKKLEAAEESKSARRRRAR